MGEDETEIGGSNGRRIQKRAARGSLKKKPKRRAFTPARRSTFLDHFAATSNVKGACRSAGVAYSTVYEWRRKNEQFRAAFNEALGHGYVTVEAELLRESARSLKIKPDPKAPPLIDPKTALAILESYRRNGERRPGDILPQRSDIEQVRARLEKKMRAMRLFKDEGEAEGGDRAG